MAVGLAPKPSRIYYFWLLFIQFAILTGLSWDFWPF